MPNTIVQNSLRVLGPAALVGAFIMMGIVSTPKEAAAGTSLGNGMSCKFSSDCESNNCVLKVCKPKGGKGKQLGNGMACSFSSDCLSNNCVLRVCKAKGGSGKQLGNGMACRLSSDCESNNCVLKVCKKR
jgi:hypothetical protein